MATYTDQLVVLDSGIVTKIAASDIIEIGGSFIIGGDLTVSGTKFTNSAETVLVADNHTYVNAGYTTNSAQTGGLVVNYLPTSTTDDTVGAGVFTAGVDGVSDPTVTTQGGGTFSAGDLVQISGSAENDGLYEVHTHSTGTPNTLTIRSTADGVTNQVEDFTNGQFVANAGDTGATITKVTVSVIRAGTDGVWESGSGSATPLTFSDLATSAGSTLQSAYEAGETISVTSGEGDIAFTLTSADFVVNSGASGNFVVNGPGNANFGAGAGTDLTGFGVGTSTFNVDATDAITLDAGAASNFTTSAGNLSLQTTGPSGGNVAINSELGDINIGNAAHTGAINIGTAGTRTVTIGSGTADIVASSGTLDVPAGTNFKIGTTALTTANFTAANVDTLLDGSNADSLHNHGTVDVEFTADGSGITAGYMVYFSADGVVTHADASGIGTARVAGWSASGITASTAGNISVSGKVTNATIESAGSLTIGSPVYLSETAGQVTATAPSSSGSAIMQVGIAYSTTEFIWQPQFIAVNP